MPDDLLLELLQSSAGHLSIEDLLREHQYFAQQTATDRLLDGMAATAAVQASRFTQKLSQSNPAAAIAAMQLDIDAARSRQAGFDSVFGRSPAVVF
jgi:hypothetical protein